MFIIQTVSAGVIADAPRLSEILLNALRVLLQFVGGLAVLMIVIAGIMYVMSGGDDARADLAKKALIGSIIGLLVVLGALVIVGTVARVF